MIKSNCIFCKILQGESTGTVSKITENWATLIPKEQISKGHILVIPSFHCETVLDLDSKKALEELGQVLKKVSIDQSRKYKADGINILNANKEAAQQSVNHLHFHIVPRYKGDNLDLWLRENI